MYRICAAGPYPEEPVKRALIYQSDPGGRFFAGKDGRLIAGQTADTVFLDPGGRSSAKIQGPP